MDDYRDYRLGSLTTFQTGIVFLALASALFVYVGYQIKTGQVFTKSGVLSLGDGLAWGFLGVEAVAAVVGVVRGVRMVRS